MIAKDNLIVIFIKEQCGTVIKGVVNKHLKIAEYSEYWIMSYFKDYDGEVNLKNNNDIRRDNN